MAQCDTEETGTDDEELRSMRIALALQAAGTTLLSVALGFVYLPAGIAAAGVALVAFGIALEKGSSAS